MEFLQQHLNEFADFKARCTTAYIDDRLQEIEKAAYLPDDQARNEKYETLRIQLTEAGAECLKLFQYLKRYIADAYPEVLHKTKTDAAGQAYYEKAMNNNWDSMQDFSPCSQQLYSRQPRRPFRQSKYGSHFPHPL